jgi:tetratricopeptide (TPR) repeat protein
MKSLCTVLLLSLALFSCAPEQEKPSVPVTTEKSIFEEVKELTVKNPSDAEAWYHLADLYERSEMYREEIEALKKVIALQPEGVCLPKLGAAYKARPARLRQPDHREKIFSKNPLLYTTLQWLMEKVGKLTEIKLLNQAISLRPNRDRTV